MELDKRSMKVLEKLIQNPSISSKDLSLSFELSRGQLNYTIKKSMTILKKRDLALLLGQDRESF